jgi:hypothetical protein
MDILPTKAVSQTLFPALVNLLESRGVCGRSWHPEAGFLSGKDDGAVSFEQMLMRCVRLLEEQFK